MSSPELKIIQEEDSDIVMLKQWLLNVWNQIKDIGAESLVLKFLLAQYKRLLYKDDIFYRKWDDFELKATKLQAVIPRS